MIFDTFVLIGAVTAMLIIGYAVVNIVMFIVHLLRHTPDIRRKKKL